MEFSGVEIIPEQKGLNSFVKVAFERLKQSGEYEFKYEFFITESKLVETIQLYMNCFDKKEGRFFRKINEGNCN